MRGAIQDRLTNAELDRLAERLAANQNPDALSLEAVDGLFCALIAAPDTVMPSGYLPVILGGNAAIVVFSRASRTLTTRCHC